MEEILNNILSGAFYRHVACICITVAAMLTAMAVDLATGVYKARQNGTARTSTGYKKSCEKGRKYFLPYSALMCIDLIGCLLLPLPAFSMIWGAFCVFCEFVSIREKAWTKAEMLKAEKTMSVIIDNKEDLAKAIISLITAAGITETPTPAAGRETNRLATPSKAIS